MFANRKRLAAAVVAAAFLVGCDGDGDADDATAGNEVGLTPTFPAAPTAEPAVSAPPPLLPGDAGTSVEGATEEVVVGTLSTVAGSPPPPVPGDLEASFRDPTGDLTVSLDPPPPWADLAGGRLIRRVDGFELRVTLGGGTAPAGSGDGAHTMNVASFYDVDGDGHIDFEVWANLAEGGWGGSWFDNGGDRASFGDESGVAISTEGADVVLRFPLGHLGGASQLRWALASEWGRFEVIGTDLAARDDAPDNDAPANFPA